MLSLFCFLLLTTTVILLPIPRMSATIPLTPQAWRAALDSLPKTPNKIPAFFFAHGSPALVYPPNQMHGRMSMLTYQGPDGPLAAFLKDFGPALLEKYNPKGVVVFSAHWETLGERLVTDYGDENPLLMDYYGFPQSLYEIKFKSSGDSQLSQRVVQLYKEAGYLARTTSKLEPRGKDGRGFQGPGLDHGVFVPFRLMWGEEFLDIPIVQVSIDSSLSPEGNWKIGKTISALREEGILVLSGGLTCHNLRDMGSMNPDTAKPAHKEFHQAILDAVTKTNEDERKQALFDLVKHSGFRASHPREEHFVPIYVAAGAGEGGNVKVLHGNFGVPTFAFGL